jgi:hypothetical protein
MFMAGVLNNLLIVNNLITNKLQNTTFVQIYYEYPKSSVPLILLSAAF